MDKINDKAKRGVIRGKGEGVVETQEVGSYELR